MKHLNRIAWGLVPFYADSRKRNYAQKIQACIETALILKKCADKIVVVDDGGNLRRDNIPCDFFAQFHDNRGKAEAIRKGLKIILRHREPKYIIQADADLDQNPAEAVRLLRRTRALAVDVRQPALVLGDRYPISLKNYAPIYRRNILFLQSVIMRKLGYKLRDVVSGFRVYNRSFAGQFVQLSRSRGYGIEFEQVIIGALIGAKMKSVHLNYSRPRASSTRRIKLLENLDAALAHRKALRRSEFSEVADCIEIIASEMKKKKNFFIVDLNPLGCAEYLAFELVKGDAYTLERFS